MLTLTAIATSVAFSVPAADGTILYGQIDHPAGRPRALVFLIQGTGPPTRDYVLAVGKVKPYAWFKSLSNRLTAQGFDVVRYDMRGYSCSKPGAPAPSRNGACKTVSEAMTTTYESKQADLLTVAHYALRETGDRCLIVIPHSEGNHHVSRLIASGQLTPEGYVGLGAPLQSWVPLMRWQDSDMIIRSIRQADANRDGVTSRAEMAKFYSRTVAGLVDGKLIGPNGKDVATPAKGWTAVELRKMRYAFLVQHDAYMRELLAKPDNAPADGSQSAQAGWLKALMTNWVPDAWLLRDYRGYLSFHQGDLDWRIDEKAAREALQAYGPPQARFRLHPGLNHFFGRQGYLGPADEQANAAIVADVVAATRSCTKPS